jgi:hypothetical protein
MVRVVPLVSISCNVLLVVDCDRSAPAKVCLIAIALASAIVVHSQIRYHHVEVELDSRLLWTGVKIRRQVYVTNPDYEFQDELHVFPASHRLRA